MRRPRRTRPVRVSFAATADTAPAYGGGPSLPGAARLVGVTQGTGEDRADRRAATDRRRPADGQEDVVDNEVLRQAPLFSALDDGAATALRGSLRETKLRRGGAVVHGGGSGDR